MSSSATTDALGVWPDADALRRRGSIKWAAFPADVIPMWVAETDLPTCPAVLDALHDAVDREEFGYPRDYGTELGPALATWCAERYGWALNPAWVHDLSDVMKGVELAISHFTRAESPVVLPTPSYMPFFEVIELCGRRRIDVPMLAGPGDRPALDFEAIEQAFREGAGSIILCSPHNPLGIVYTADELRTVTELAAQHGARVIADEIHAPIVFSGAHVAAASVSDAAADVTITLTATSKAWNTPGLKCAQIVFSNSRDEAVWAQLPFLATFGTSSLGLVAAVAAYRSGGPWLDAAVDRLRSRRDLAVGRLREAVPGLRVRSPDASYLAWLDFAGVPSTGADPQAFILERARVALSPGRPFGAGAERCARMNFATSEAILRDAIERIASAIGDG